MVLPQVPQRHIVQLTRAHPLKKPVDSMFALLKKVNLYEKNVKETDIHNTGLKKTLLFVALMMGALAVLVGIYSSGERTVVTKLEKPALKLQSYLKIADKNPVCACSVASYTIQDVGEPLIKVQYAHS